MSEATKLKQIRLVNCAQRKTLVLFDLYRFLLSYIWCTNRNEKPAGL